MLFSRCSPTFLHPGKVEGGIDIFIERDRGNGNPDTPPDATGSFFSRTLRKRGPKGIRERYLLMKKRITALDSKRPQTGIQIFRF